LRWWIGGSQTYTLRKPARTLIFGIHTGHNTAGNVRSLVANHVTEFKNFNFWTNEKIVKLKDSQLEIREVEKKSK
jgi:hypothetical protein